MPLTFRVLDIKAYPSSSGRNLVELAPGNWDDFSYKTSFEVILFNELGEKFELGNIKLGYVGQPVGWSLTALDQTFQRLSSEWFSLGQDVEYYQAIRENLSEQMRDELLIGLCDVVADDALLTMAKKEKVLSESLMRTVSLSVIYGQFRRVLEGEAVLTEYKFEYRSAATDKKAGVTLQFQVDPVSTPSTNIHVLIGRNGVGKTTLLNQMAGAILNREGPQETSHGFYSKSTWREYVPLPADYFSSVVSVSFSAFDPFVPPQDQPDRSQGVGYFYIGMKSARADGTDATVAPKTDNDLADDFQESLESCLSQQAKRQRWGAAISRLESDENFADMGLRGLLDLDLESAMEAAKNLAGTMSSGHAIVLLTMTKLVDTVEEKTLVLMDEPESHLHPPLLSAFTRALSDLLHNRNGVAIVATHSPVVLQEVPKSCVWKLSRRRTEGRADRPERETFGENVGVLTREVFGLEVSKSGFHEVLEAAVDKGLSFEQVMAVYEDQLGVEAQGIVRALISARNR